MRLSDEELRDVLARAEEIERTTRHGDAWNAEVAAVIGAGEGVGISRLAVERALAERMNLPAALPQVGALAWARSADGKFYVAEVLAASENDAKVRFLRGGEQVLSGDALKPCAFIPGQRIGCQWPVWGPWICTVVSYDPEKQRVKLTDGWGSFKTYPIWEVWLAPEKASPAGRRRVYALLAAGGAAGALLGSIVTAILLR